MHLWVSLETLRGFSDGSASKESTCNAGDTADAGSIPGSGMSFGERNGNSVRYSCLGNPMTEEPTVHGAAKESDLTEQWNTAQKNRTARLSESEKKQKEKSCHQLM